MRLWTIAGTRGMWAKAIAYDPFVESALKWIGGLVVAGGGGAVIAMVILRSVGERWLASEFDKRLEAFKHEQHKEMEQVRYRINSDVPPRALSSGDWIPVVIKRPRWAFFKLFVSRPL